MRYWPHCIGCLLTTPVCVNNMFITLLFYNMHQAGNKQAVVLRNLQIDQVISTNQWRIQDFPLIWPFPSKNCVKLKIIWRRPNVSSSPGSVNASIIITCSIRCQLLISAIFFHLNCLSLNINHFKIFFPFVQVYAHISCECTKFIKTSSSLLYAKACLNSGWYFLCGDFISKNVSVFRSSCA